MSKQKGKKDRRQRYFRQKGILIPLGIAILIVGGLVFWYGSGWISYYLSIAAMPTGIVIAAIGSARSVSDAYVAEQISNVGEGYDAQILKNEKTMREVLKFPASVESEAYSFGEDAEYYRRGKGGVMISNRYTRAHFFTKASLLVALRRLDLIELNSAGVSDLIEKYSYADIREEIERKAKETGSP